MAIHRLFSFLLLALAITTAAPARLLEEEASVQTPVSSAVNPTATTPAPVQTPVSSTVTPTATPATATATSVASGGPDHPLTFFMHDIIGGSNPTARAVTGIVNNPAVNGQVAFAKSNGIVINVNNGIPTNNGNSALIDNNNLPFLTGLSSTTPNVVQTNSNNGGAFNVGFPVLNSGQLPSGTALQKLMFGTLTAFDDELTEGHELGSGLMGRAQGFYLSSSIDGTSQTLAFTAMFADGGYADSLIFFGVLQKVVSESHLAIMGGTGKYVNAKGFAIVKTFPAAAANQHNTDGVETVLEINVYFTY
ncbi:hypothetical protein NMG60_11033951 [Bertholletia excelsa]